MRYVTFSVRNENTQQIGIVQGDRVIPLRKRFGAQWEGPFPSSLHEFIQIGPEAWRRMALLARSFQGKDSYSLDEVHLYSPIPRPAKNVFCLGLNYVSHMEESARARGREIKIPEVPVFFTKTPTSVSGPYDAIPWDTAVTKQVDYEAELGVVIGIAGKNIPAAKALDHVFGYTIINDVSARDLQKDHMQWFKGKSLDGFCPIGPWIVTADEFGDPQTKAISLRVNGVTKQSSNTRHMIFTVAVTIESLSKGMTLEPGDIISTGTPEGVGLGRTPPEYLKDGDLVETEIEGIGVMKNRVVAIPKSEPRP
jgi:2-keto-4-pentenoate hydratase/2-oxohepta-3-ene-1,7-dioic acid hydratase in catechol pathway